MSRTTGTRDRAQDALKLAREIRVAIRDRSLTIEAALERYDAAATEEDRADSAAVLMRVVGRADREYHARKAQAFGDFAAGGEGAG